MSVGKPKLPVTLPVPKSCLDAIPDGYELVELKRSTPSVPSGDDAKSPAPAKALVMGVHQMLAGHNKNTPFKVRLWQKMSATSAAATAQAISNRMRFSDHSEASSLAVLFQEARALGGGVYARASTATVSALNVSYWSAAYLPDTFTPSSVVDVLSAFSGTGPVLTSSAGGPTSFSTSNAFVHFKFSVPKGIVNSGNATNADVMGGWFDTGYASATYGYHIVYVDAQGASTTTQYDAFIYTDFELRGRR